MSRRTLPAACTLAAACLGWLPVAHAQEETAPGTATELGKVQVTAIDRQAAQSRYNTRQASLGPLGEQSILDTPFSVTVVPATLIANQQAKTVNDILRDLPSVQIRDQQGLEVSRPQSRGFQGTITQNTRLDGLNIIGTTAVPGENLAGIEVLNGMAGSLYGPQTPAGVFNYVLKRPSDTPHLSLSESFDSRSVLTEAIDAGGRTGPDQRIGYQINVVHGEGDGYVKDSRANRTLFSGAFDFHLDDQTVIETNLSHYETSAYGLPGSIVYDSGKSTTLPHAVNPKWQGLGQPDAGTDLTTNTGLVKLKHRFNEDWSFEIGGLYQHAVRDLYGITNTFTDNAGHYTVTKNFNAVPKFTVASNLAQLNGHFDSFGLRNDLTVATNGFSLKQYSYRNSIATVLGSGSLADPTLLPSKPIPATGGQYQAGSLQEQSLILGDTIHWNAQWSTQAVLNEAYINAKSYNKNGQQTSSDVRHGVFSPTLSLIYQPSTQWTTYASASRSVEQGEAAPTGSANANQYLSPYRDKQYELGAKYATRGDLLLSMAVFRMTRPLAITDADSNVFAVAGTQRNTGAELYAQGSVTPELSLLGGVTYINAVLRDTGLLATNDKQVVGVPRVKSDLSLDYHPRFAAGYALTGSVHFESRRAATNTNNSYAPAFATFDAGVRYVTDWGRHLATLRLQVINLTDKHYYASVADGNIVGSPGANTAYFGTPRTVQASVQMDL